MPFYFDSHGNLRLREIDQWPWLVHGFSTRPAGSLAHPDGQRRFVQLLAGDGVTLEVHVSSTALLVRIDPGQLEQVLLNLVVNARDAMPGGGTIGVEVGALELDARAALRYSDLTGGTYARIAVTDTGEGIDPDAQPHIFEPFFTTKGPSKGTGLGLSIVYGIAKEAGGTVSFSTRPGQGTTFEVLLPLSGS